MTDLTVDSTLHLPEMSRPRSSSNSKTVVVGLYGVPGAGKTFLLHQLRRELGEKDFAFYEGSEMIAKIVPAGLNAFQNMEEQEKVQWRQCAIDEIGRYSHNSGQAAIVTGHFMFWSEEHEAGRSVYTQKDLETFTHILYLDVPSKVVIQRRMDETERCRPLTSESHLQKWQQEEKNQLRRLCRNHGILFSLISPHLALPKRVSTLLRDFRYHSEEHNLSQAEIRLDEAIFRRKRPD